MPTVGEIPLAVVPSISRASFREDSTLLGFQPCIVNNAWLGDTPRYIEFVLTDPTASHFDLVGLAPSIPLTYPGSTTTSRGYYEDDGGK